MQDYKERQEKTAVDQKLRSMTLGDVGGCQPVQTYFESLRSCASHASEVRGQARDLLALIVGPMPTTNTKEAASTPPDNLKFALDHFPESIHDQLYNISATLFEIRDALRL